MARYFIHHLTIKVLSMSRPVIAISFLLCSVLLSSSMNASLLSPQNKQLALLPPDPQKALIDPRAVKRQEALETLKRHPKLIQYLQENREALALEGRPTAQQNVVAPQQMPGAVKELLNTLKQEQEKSPQRPLFVSVNVNTQSLCNDVNTVHKTTASPPTEELPPEDSPFFAWGTQGLDWARAHKGRCLWYSFIGCFGGIHLYLFFIRKYLSQEGSWSRWKNHLTLEELYRITTTALVKEVIRSKIGSTHPLGATTLRTTLKQCTQEIDSELSTLSWYKSFLICLQAVPFRRLFLWNTTIVDETALRIQRLSYVKNTILSFLDVPVVSQDPDHSSLRVDKAPAR